MSYRVKKALFNKGPGTVENWKAHNLLRKSSPYLHILTFFSVPEVLGCIICINTVHNNLHK